MEDFIIDNLLDLIQKSENLGGSGTGLDIIMQTPAEFNGAIYTNVKDIAEVVVLPIAYSILALIFLLKFATIVKRIDSGGSMNGIGVPVKLLFAFVICKIAVDNSITILGAVYEISDKVMTGIDSHLSSQTVSSFSPDINALRNDIDQMSFAVKLMTAAQTMMISLIYKFAELATNVILVGRMIQIYIMTAVAPIPLSLFGNEHTSNISKNFLKKFSAVCFQAVLIFIILKIYGGLVNSVSAQLTSEASLDDLLWKNLFLMIVLVVSIFTSSKLATSIFNAN